MKIFTNWSYFLRFLWFIAGTGMVAIMYGWYVTTRDSAQNQAAGLAMVGVVWWAYLLLIFVAFIGLNYYMKHKLKSRASASAHYLMTMWILFLLTIVVSVGVIVKDAAVQTQYEQNIQPKLDRCYQEYLDGKRSTPYEGCL